MPVLDWFKDDQGAMRGFSQTGNDWAKLMPDRTLQGGGSLQGGQPQYPMQQQTNQMRYGGVPQGPQPVDWTQFYGQPQTPMQQPNIRPPEGPLWNPQQGGPRSGGFGGGGVPVRPPVNVSMPYTPPTQTYNRYQQILNNPAAFQNDPAYQFLVNQGENALSRSAGAKRMRFSGKNMLDFQNFGQQAANQYRGAELGNLSQGTGLERDLYNQEYQYRLADAMRKAEFDRFQAEQNAAAADPYGQARNVASRYASADEYIKAFAPQMLPGYGTGIDTQRYRDIYEKGRRLNQSFGIG